jgi:hypothetical protein
MSDPADIARRVVEYHASLTGHRPHSANAISDLLCSLLHLIERDMESSVDEFLYVALEKYWNQQEKRS